MWGIIFIALGLIYGAFARQDEGCLLKAQKSCRVYSIFPSEFPTNLSELRRDCSNLYSVIGCISATLRTCNAENAGDDRDRGRYRVDYTDNNRESNEVKDMQRLIDVTTQICDENSDLHQSFVPYLSCVKAAMDKDFEEQNCRDYTKSAIEFLSSRIESKARMASGDEEKFQEVQREIISCLRVLFGMNCFIIQAKKTCDAGVKQPLLEIIDKGGSLYYQCPASSRIDVLELLDAMKLVSRKKIHVKKLIQNNPLF